MVLLPPPPNVCTCFERDWACYNLSCIKRLCVYQLFFQLVLLGVRVRLPLLSIGMFLLQISQLPLEFPGQLLTWQLLGPEQITFGVEFFNGFLEPVDLGLHATPGGLFKLKLWLELFDLELETRLVHFRHWLPFKWLDLLEQLSDLDWKKCDRRWLLKSVRLLGFFGPFSGGWYNVECSFKTFFLKGNGIGWPLFLLFTSTIYSP